MCVCWSPKTILLISPLTKFFIHTGKGKDGKNSSSKRKEQQLAQPGKRPSRSDLFEEAKPDEDVIDTEATW